MIARTLLVLAFVLGGQAHAFRPKVGQPPPPHRPALEFRVINVSLDNEGTRVVINAGSDQGIGLNWHATLLDDAGHPLAGGELTLISVRRRECFARTKLTPDQVNRHFKVRLDPP